MNVSVSQPAQVYVEQIDRSGAVLYVLVTAILVSKWKSRRGPIGGTKKSMSCARATSKVTNETIHYDLRMVKKHDFRIIMLLNLITCGRHRE